MPAVTVGYLCVSRGGWVGGIRILRENLGLWAALLKGWFLELSQNCPVFVFEVQSRYRLLDSLLGFGAQEARTDQIPGSHSGMLRPEKPHCLGAAGLCSLGFRAL